MNKEIEKSINWNLIVCLKAQGIILSAFADILKSDFKYKWEVEKMNKEKKNVFKYKCLCSWSKDDKYGFIPDVNCPVHGKQAKKLLKDAVPYEKPSKSVKR